MKVALWRQVSSNHSNGFTVVGVFEDPADAEKAYKRIRKLLKTIDAWCEDNDIDKYENWDVLEPERRIAAEYRFQWPLESPTDFGTEAVRYFRNIVSIDTSADSWTRRKPYELLLKKLGGDVAGWDSQEEGEDTAPKIFRVSISATAPDEAAAARFARRWENQLREKNARLSRDGRQVAIANLVFDLPQFTTIVKALERARFADVRYELKKKAYKGEDY